MTHLNMGPGRPRNARRGAPAEVTPVRVSREQRQTVYMAASLMLDYPREGFDECVEAVAQATSQLPEPLAGEFASFCRWAGQAGRRHVEEEYVRTFDEQRRCALELSYYAAGDTRQRGQALLAFRELLKAAGFEQTDDELPDYLPTILELCAKSDDVVVDNVLPSHREGLEVLRSALFQRDSPWTGVVTAICEVLPQIDDATRERYQQLIRQGPPGELVGIADLPFPTVQEALT
ncbi:nitrate reductase molybdenum cofactor assembly chaperone [Actinomycetaceae bacterium L2_0104]